MYCGLSHYNYYLLFSFIIPKTRVYYLATPQRCWLEEKNIESAILKGPS